MAKSKTSTAVHAALQDLRNIGIIAHIDAGKTTTTERVLYYTGASHKMGEVDDGTTETDFDPEEAARGITIYSAAVTCRWRDKTINIIDTPGHVDFTAEVERSLRVLDGAVTIFSAVEGVEAQSETVWRQADRYGVPRICFINKMDRIGASFERTLGQIESRLAAAPLPLTIPIGEGPAFEGIIDLRIMRRLRFDTGSKGQDVQTDEIPESMRETAEQWQSKLLETVAMLDDEVMESYLETGTIEPDDINRLLRVATIAGQVQPIFCGSSLDYIGVQPLLDAVVEFLPSPLDRPAVEGIDLSPKADDDATVVREPSPDEPLAALVFKIVADAHGELSFARVYSGTLKAGSRPLNPRLNKKEFASQLVLIQAGRREQVDEAVAGEIVGIIGLKDTVTGDTLCDPQQPVALEPITFPQTVISMAVEPESSADRKKLEDTLAKLSRQDPTFTARVSADTGQTIISGMGELHLEVLRNRLLRDFNLNVRVHKPRVSYRETVKAAVRATGTFSRPAGDAMVFGEVTVKLEPRPADWLERQKRETKSGKKSGKSKGQASGKTAAEPEADAPVSIVNAVKPGTVDGPLMRAVEESIADAAASGGIVGYPLLDVLVTIEEVTVREGESTEDAMRAAASMAFQHALNDAQIALLEPVMKLEVVSPDESVGAIQADLNQRHAVIVGQEPRGEQTVLQAQAPLAAMFGYSTQIRSLSQGRAGYSMEPLKYEPAPESVMKEMMGF